LRFLPLAAAILAFLATAAPGASEVGVFPSSQTITATGPLPSAAAEAELNAAIGEREGAWIVARDANVVSAAIDASGLGGVEAALAWGHFVDFSGRLIPDALTPWDGSPRQTEQPNQPLYLRVTVPYGTPPGRYSGSVTVTTDDTRVTVPFTVRVFPVVLTAPGSAAGNFLTSFRLAAGTYVNRAAALYGFGTPSERLDANAELYAFLAAYRISPSSWGFGEPTARTGYENSPEWHLDAASNMRRQVAAGPFSAMRIPISGNRASPGLRIAGVPYDEPETWCDYLRAVYGFWAGNGWLGTAVPYLYALDEPGAAAYPLMARQSSALHECWPGAKSLVTVSPSAENRFAFDNAGTDELDIWAILSRRFYGRFTVPLEQETGDFRSRTNHAWIDAVRKRGKAVWSYTYSGVPGTPGYAASEPLSNPRMFLLWNALEGTDGTLYGQGTTTYTAANPLDSVEDDGEFVLLYPGPRGVPIASARLEQIRDGIEDALVLAAVRRTRGAPAVWSILGEAGLFSATRKGIELACTMGCDLPGTTKYSWPRWSRDATTPRKIEAARLAALEAAAALGAGRPSAP
jgi:hypothetical protein